MYKAEKDFTERKLESQTMLNRFNERIPIIVERRRNNIVPIDKRKFMAPESLTMGQFTFVIRKRLKLQPSEAVFLFINNKLINQSRCLKEEYDTNKDEDGFLYVYYDFENAFG